MSRDPKKEYRDPVTKRYAYWNDWGRMCICGHNLGRHIAGGFECMGTKQSDCDCEKFKPVRKRTQR